MALNAGAFEIIWGQNMKYLKSYEVKFQIARKYGAIWGHMRSNSQYSENMEYLRSYEVKLQIARKYEAFEVIWGQIRNIPKIVRRPLTSKTQLRGHLRSKNGQTSIFFKRTYQKSECWGHLMSKMSEKREAFFKCNHKMSKENSWYRFLN